MVIVEASTHKFERHLDNPRRIYAKNLSHGLDMSDRYKHRKIWWFGLWFFELRLSMYSKPN